jgi:acetyl esterase/lipase
MRTLPPPASYLSGLPSAFISVGALDLFAVEDISFAEHLMQAGVATELHDIPGGISQV